MNQSGAGFKLGLFVVSGIVLAVATVFALGAGAFLEKRQPLYCYFTESVKGLERDSAVTYRGVRIGRVVRVIPQIGKESRGPSAAGDIRVECEIDPRLMGIEDLGVFTQGETVTQFVEKQVRHGLRVQLSMGDLIGSKYLELDFLAAEDAPLPDLGFDPMQPYVPTLTAASLSDIQQGLFETLQSISQVQYAEISKRLVDLLTKLDAKASEADVEGISQRANKTLDSADRLLGRDELGRSVERLDRITADLESASKSLNALLTRESTTVMFDDAAAAMTSFRRVAHDLEKRVPETLAQVDELIARTTTAVDESRLPETTASIRGAADEVGGAARSVSALRDDLAAALRELSAAARSITRLARTLEERPDALLNGKSRRDEDLR